MKYSPLSPPRHQTDRSALSSSTPRFVFPTRAACLAIAVGFLASACSGGDDSALDDLAPSPDVTAERTESSAAVLNVEADEQSDDLSAEEERSERTTTTVTSTTSVDPAGDQHVDDSITTDTDDAGTEGSAADDAETDDAETDDAETDESSSSDIITDAEAAGEWVDASSRAFAAYFVEAITGDGADFSLLEAAAEFYDDDSLVVDLPSFNRCNVADILPLREFLGDDGIYTVEGRVLGVREANDSVWIVDYRVTQFVTGIGDTVTDQTVFVGPNGVFGTRPSTDAEDQTCEQEALSHTATGQVLFDEAVASDQ